MITGQNFRFSIDSEKRLADAYDDIYLKKIIATDNVKFYTNIVEMTKSYMPKGKFLDISCGLGYVVNFANMYGYRSYGIDISKRVSIIAKREFSSCDFIISSSERLPFENESFDIITNLGSLEHYIDMENAIRESVRILKKNGIVLYMMPNQYFLPTIVKVLFTGEPNDKIQPIERFASYKEWYFLLEKWVGNYRHL